MIQCGQLPPTKFGRGLLARNLLNDLEGVLFKMKELLSEIDQIQSLFNKKRPLPKETLKSIREDLIIKWTYNSNAIEGNTLTLSETKVVLEDGITINGKSVREHLEIINHRDAIYFLEELIRDETNLTQHTIRQVHGLILSGIDRNNAGNYRKQQVLIGGAEHIPPAPLLIPEKMDKLMDWYNNQAQDLHPVKRAAILHSEFVKIHPFIDGNGRTGRLLLNFDLMKSGYVPIIIKKDQRPQYMQALDHYSTTGESDSFIKLVGNNLKRMLTFYLDFLK